MIGSHSKECQTPDSPQAKMDNSLCNLSHRRLYNGKEIHKFQLENCTYCILLITRDLVNHTIWFRGSIHRLQDLRVSASSSYQLQMYCQCGTHQGKATLRVINLKITLPAFPQVGTHKVQAILKCITLEEHQFYRFNYTNAVNIIVFSLSIKPHRIPSHVNFLSITIQCSLSKRKKKGRKASSLIITLTIHSEAQGHILSLLIIHCTL